MIHSCAHKNYALQCSVKSPHQLLLYFAHPVFSLLTSCSSICIFNIFPLTFHNNYKKQTTLPQNKQTNIPFIHSCFDYITFPPTCIIFMYYSIFFVEFLRPPTTVRVHQLPAACAMCRFCSPLQVCNRSRYVKLFPSCRFVSEEVCVEAKWKEVGRGGNLVYGGECAYGSNYPTRYTYKQQVPHCQFFMHAAMYVYAMVKQTTKKKNKGPLWAVILNL